MHFRITICLVLAGLLSLAARAEVPFTFQSGTPAQASQVNQNFQSLDSRLSTAIGGFTQWVVAAIDADDSAVATATCPANSVAMSANCNCDYVNGTRNLGVLIACQVAGNGGVAACLPEGVLYKSSLPLPRTNIKLICLAGQRIDGSTIAPVPLASGTEGAGRQKTSKEQADELDAATKAARDQVADQTATLKAAAK